MNQLIERNSKHSIECPSCGNVPVFDDDNLQITFHNGDEESPFITILHLRCREEKPKKFHICLKCGTKNNQGMSQLVKRYCKCAENNNVPAPAPASPLAPPSNPNPPDGPTPAPDPNPSPPAPAPAASSLADELNFELSANDEGDLTFGASADANDNVEDDTEQMENENKQFDMAFFFQTRRNGQSPAQNIS